MRVAIVQDARTLRLSVEGAYKLIDCASAKIIYQGRDLKSTVTVDEHGLRMGEIDSPAASIMIKASKPEAIIINDRNFRGDIQIIKKGEGRLAAVNFIEIEDYIKGVLYHEASHHWPAEALKAQAVVSRTFAVYKMQENKHNYYDVTCDIYSQVYGGRVSERYRTNQAIAETKGLVLTFENKIFPTYYHASCGGHTEDASLLWNIDILPLKGVVCGFCNGSPHFVWHRVLKKKEIINRLSQGQKRLDDIRQIVILEKDKSGRVLKLSLKGQGQEVEIKAKDFRILIGPNIIRSTNFEVEVIGDEVIFRGVGWGHGVGLCQWGAYFMAREGKDFKQILEYYYPASRLVLISEVR